MFRQMIAVSAFLTFAACGGEPEEDPRDSFPNDTYSTGTGDTGTHKPPPSSSTNESVAELVVGAWGGGAVCVTQEGDELGFAYYWYLCPNGNMKGASIIDGDYYFEFLDDGTYDVSEAARQATVAYWSTVVTPEEIRGDREYLTQKLAYDPSDDSLTFVTMCPVPMERLPEAVTNANCD